MVREYGIREAFKPSDNEGHNEHISVPVDFVVYFHSCTIRPKISIPPFLRKQSWKWSATNSTLMQLRNKLFQASQQAI